jgi:hypothetical protein
MVEAGKLLLFIRPHIKQRRKRPLSTQFGLFPVNEGAGYRVYIVVVMKLTNQERERLRVTIDDSIIIQSIDFDPHNLPNIVISKGCEQKHLDAYAALCTRGCDPITLLWSLRLGRAAIGRPVPSPPSAKALKAVVKRLEDMASEIAELEKSGFLTIVVREDVQQFYQEKKVGMEDVEEFGEALPHLDLPRWLKKKADMYRRWLKIASLRVSPREGRKLSRLEYLFPAIYVYEATGEPCLPLLMRLFKTIGIRVSREQLSREFVSLRREYRWLRMLMEEKLHIVSERTSGMYEEELSALAAKLLGQQDGSTRTNNLTQGMHKKGTK